MQDQRERCHDNEYPRDEFAEQECRDCERERDDADSPIPVGLFFSVEVRRSAP